MANGRGWRYPEDFRRMAVERFKCCENIEWLAKGLGVPRQTLYRWQEESEQAEGGEEQVIEKSRESRLRREIAAVRSARRVIFVRDCTEQTQHAFGYLHQIRHHSAPQSNPFPVTSGHFRA